MIPGQFTECIMLYALRRHIEQDRAESRNDAHQYRQPEKPNLTAHPSPQNRNSGNQAHDPPECSVWFGDCSGIAVSLGAKN